MKACIALTVLCIVLLQGVHVNCQSLDSIMSSLNSYYVQYQSGTLVPNLLSSAREYLSTAISSLNQLQNFINSFQIPQLPQIPQVPAPTTSRPAWSQWGRQGR